MTRCPRIAVAFVALAVGTTASFALAASPISKSLKCRKAIATGVTQIANSGLKQITACHAKRDKGKTTADCNQLTGGAYAATRTRASSTVGVLCGRDAYLDRFPNGTIDATIFAATGAALNANGVAVEGSPNVGGDKAKIKCRLAIGKARNAVVADILRRESQCQKALDKKAPDLEHLVQVAPDCVSAPSTAEASARAKIAKACGSLSGADVGSCTPLPDCVIDSATATAHDLGRYAYGPCGDNITDQAALEQCDDGNTDDTDACVACANATCGDGSVEAGVEECDDGNDVDTDACVACKNAFCGDGFVLAGTEECDDGNNVPGDGCTDCRADKVSCGNVGMDATITLVDAPAAAHDITGIRIDVVYGPPLTLPGAGIDPNVTARVTDISGVGGFSSVSNNDANGDHVADTLTNAYVSQSSTIPLADFERVRFDCTTQAAFSPAAVHCLVHDAADSLGNPTDPGALPACKVTLVPASTGATTTTSSSTSTSTAPPPPTTSTTSTTIVGTTSTTTSSTTSTIPGSPVCGNNNVESGETCDDGNTLDGDSCPSTCVIQVCSPTASTRTFTVSFAGPANTAAVQVLLDYPEGKIGIPGSGNDSNVIGSIKNTPPGALLVSNDLDYALIQSVTSLSALTPGPIFTVHFNDCQGATVPTAGDFTCTVTDAADTAFNTVTGVTCSVSAP